MTKNLIAFCGYARSGKDTAAEALIQRGWKRIGFADPIREIALKLNPIVDRIAVTGVSVRLKYLVSQFGWTQAKLNSEVRRILQVIGTDVGRNIIGENVWVALASQRIHRARESGAPGVVIADCRFSNEAALIHALGGQVIQISRPGFGPVNDHESEKWCGGHDAEILNGGTIADLHANVLKAIGLTATENRCECHDRDGSYVCKYCFLQGFRGHMEEGNCPNCGAEKDAPCRSNCPLRT